MTEKPRSINVFFSEGSLIIMVTGWPGPPVIRTADGEVLERTPIAVSETGHGPMASTATGRASAPGAWSFSMAVDPSATELPLVLEVPGEEPVPFKARRRQRPHADPAVQRLADELRESLTRPAQPTSPTSGALQ